MSLLNLQSNEDYMFFIKSYNVKNSILEILDNRFSCEISKKMFNHFKYFDDKILDNYNEFNIILPHKKLQFLTTKTEDIKLDYIIQIKNNKIIPVNNMAKKLKFFLQ
jgi:hypothetical protein